MIFGAGGHSKVVAEAINSTREYLIAGYFDINPRLKAIEECPVFSSINDLKKFVELHEIEYAAVAVGNNDARKKLQHEAIAHNLKLPVIKHSSAIVSPKTEIKQGTVILPGAIINPDSFIGEGVIVNSGAIIEHDCHVGSYTHIAPGTVLCGGVRVGMNSFIGAKSVVIPLIDIGSNTTVGAGSVIIRNLANDSKVYGNPGRPPKVLT